MSRRRGYQLGTAAVVVAAWVAFYFFFISITTPLTKSETAGQAQRELAIGMTIPASVYVLAALLVLHYWLTGPGARLSTMDPAGRLLATAVATLPDRRRGWGAAMAAELAEIPDRPARWRFALSCARAAISLPPAGGWPVLALVAGGVVAAVTATGQAAGAAVPGVGADPRAAVRRRRRAGRGEPGRCGRDPLLHRHRRPPVRRVRCRRRRVPHGTPGGGARAEGGVTGR